MLSNPPFGVEWKKVEKEVRKEHEQQGFTGRFGPGLPRVSDGSMLFLLHLISKMRTSAEGGSRFAIVLNGSPCSPAARAAARAKSAGRSSRTTCWKPSSRCPRTCSTTPASPPTSGS